VSNPTPLLDFFKRGEAAHDVRVLAAQGALAPRAVEQLAILIHHLGDSDPHIRTLAEATLNRIPVPVLQAFLGRSDVPVDVREFFGDRGVFPDEIPTIELDDALFADESDEDLGGSVDDAPDGKEGLESVSHRVAKMTFVQRLKAALKGSREVRAFLVRDPNKIVALSVLSSSKVTESEVEGYARMPTVCEDVLRTIGASRSWTKNYGIVVALTKNPKTPIAMSLNLMHRLNDRDLNLLSMDRNVPDPLRVAARKRVVQATSRR
jgi:hypothetical protein